MWVPCGALWLCAVFYLPYLCHLPTVNGWKHKGALNWLKLVGVQLLASVFLTEIIYNLVENGDGKEVPLANTLRPVVGLGTCVGIF